MAAYNFKLNHYLKPPTGPANLGKNTTVGFLCNKCMYMYVCMQNTLRPPETKRSD